MTNEEAKQLYFEAQAHYERQAFEPALDLLNQLDAARPSSRHVMYQRALCLAKLHALDEAEELMRKLEGKIEPGRMESLRSALVEARGALKGNTEAPATAATADITPTENGANVFVIESVHPVGADTTTVTGHVKSGVFHTGDTLTILSPQGMPVMAPLLRIGTAETPLQLIRAGQKSVLLIEADPSLVVVGSSVTSQVQEESYAETMVVSTESPRESSSDSTPLLLDAEKLIKNGSTAQARSMLEKFLAEAPRHRSANRLLAQTWLAEGEDAEHAGKALEAIRRAYENSGADDPAVIDILAKCLALTGEANQGLRFLERLYAATTAFEARAALGQRIQQYREAHQLGHIWEFADNYGDVVFTSTAIEEIVKAISNGTVAKDAKFRRDHIGEWREIESALAPEHPEIQALYAAKAGSNALLSGLIYILAALVVAVIVGVVIVNL